MARQVSAICEAPQINHTKSLFGYASDPDCQRVKVDDGEWSIWSIIADEVNSGNTLSDHHIWWEVSGGGEIVEDGANTKYGQSALYQAPEYQSGSNIREVIVTAKADDFNRGDETPTNRGFGDSNPGEESITLNIWQVTVTANQSGVVGINNDAGYPDPNNKFGTHNGGSLLGWVEWNDPNGCEYYASNTEAKGLVPSGIKDSSGNDIVTDFIWKQDRKGVTRYMTTASDPDWANIVSEPNWVEEPVLLSWADGDCRHINGSSGTNTHEIFMLDAPGYEAGASNDSNIAIGWRKK